MTIEQLGAAQYHIQHIKMTKNIKSHSYEYDFAYI